MAFYPHQFPAFYAYPMPFPNQEYFSMYPPNQVDPNGHHFYQDTNNNTPTPNMSPYSQLKLRNDKPGYNNRKDSQDSGISDFSSSSSRKTSNTSTISNSSIMEESSLEDVKEEDSPFETPDDELCVQIVQQVEFYFSDANISKDKFLLKHVKRNKEGFVSLKLISSFKRVKHLTKDWRQVAYAIERKSDKLECNDVQTKVRRLESLPEYDETTPSRTVVSLNLPIEKPTIESVAEIFSVCGDIVLVRILRPGNPIPADVRPFVNKHPEMLSKVCALIEYERTEFALKAVKDLHQNEEDKIKVMELTNPPPAKTKVKNDEKRRLSLSKLQQPQQGQQPQRRYSQGMAPPAFNFNNNDLNMNNNLAPRRKISLFHNMKFSPIAEEQQKANSLNPNAPVFMMQQRRLSRPSQTMGPPPGAFMMHSAQPISAWMTRRISGQLDIATSGLALPPNVIRQPRGPPENGRGFQKWCRSRMEPAPRKSSKPSEIDAINEDEKSLEEASVALAAAAIHVEAVAPLVVELGNDDSASSSDEDEGHFSDHLPEPDMYFENERSR